MTQPDDIKGAEFDAYTANYNEEINKALNFSGLDIDFFARVKNDYLVDILDARQGGAAKAELLDVGCGVANAHKQLTDRVGRISGVDVSSASIAVARQRNPGIHYEVFDGTHLPFGNKSFDCAFAINVFHHVPIALRSALVADVRRVLRPGGLFVIFEHNPFNPVTRRIVNTCEFDKDAVLLKRRDSETLLDSAGFNDISTRYIFSVPAAGPLLRRVDRLFSLLPFGAQYYSLGTSH
ncbi:class I SAM-dependent methyltransferase [Bradyrhizobium sp. USDA 3364]